MQAFLRRLGLVSVAPAVSGHHAAMQEPLLKRGGTTTNGYGHDTNNVTYQPSQHTKKKSSQYQLPRDATIDDPTLTQLNGGSYQSLDLLNATAVDDSVSNGDLVNLDADRNLFNDSPSSVPLRKSRNIVLLGSSMSGKTGICYRLIFDRFDDNYEPTMQSTYSKLFTHKGHDIELMVKDTQGIQDNEQIGTEYGLGYHAYLLVFSVYSRRSFDSIKLIHRKLIALTGTDTLPIVLVGAKADIQSPLSGDIAKAIEHKVRKHMQHHQMQHQQTNGNATISPSAQIGKPATFASPNANINGVQSADQQQQQQHSSPNATAPAPPAHHHQQRQVSRQEAANLAKTWNNTPYIEVSAKYDLNIDNMVHTVLEEIDRQNEPPSTYTWELLNPITLARTINYKLLMSAQMFDLQTIEHLCQLCLTLMLLFNTLLLLSAILIVHRSLYDDDSEFISYLCFADGLLLCVTATLGLIGIHKQTLEYIMIATNATTFTTLIETLLLMWTTFTLESLQQGSVLSQAYIIVVGCGILLQALTAFATYIFQSVIMIQQHEELYAVEEPTMQYQYNT